MLAPVDWHTTNAECRRILPPNPSPGHQLLVQLLQCIRIHNCNSYVSPSDSTFADWLSTIGVKYLQSLQVLKKRKDKSHDHKGSAFPPFTNRTEKASGNSRLALTNCQLCIWPAFIKINISPSQMGCSHGQNQAECSSDSLEQLVLCVCMFV